MAFKSIVAHRLYRASPTAPVELSINEGCWPLSGKTEDCVRALKYTWLKRGGKIYGRFSDDIGANPLPGWLKGWQEGAQPIERMTAQWMKHAQALFAQTENVLDVYFLFAHEVVEGGDQLWLFLVGHEPAFVIGGDLQLGDSVYLDTNSILMAAKIQLTEWHSGDSAKYLTFVRAAGEKELTEWFEAVVGFTDKVDSIKQTEQLLTVVEAYTRQMPEGVAEQTREKVVEYCLEQSKAGESVKLEALSKVASFDGAPEFAIFVKTQEVKPPEDLIPHAGQLRQYVRISGRNEQMSMSFASGCLGEDVVYDAQNDSLTIKKIPPALKTRLLKHMK